MKNGFVHKCKKKIPINEIKLKQRDATRHNFKNLQIYAKVILQEVESSLYDDTMGEAERVGGAHVNDAALRCGVLW